MSQIVHITFEKLTGLKGEIEGDFVVVGRIDQRLPLIFEYWASSKSMAFRHNRRLIYILPLDIESFNNYLEHFTYGTNFLIKSWSYGGGVTINSQPPN